MFIHTSRRSPRKLRSPRPHNFRWDASEGATGYRLYWGTSTGTYPPGNVIDVGDVLSYSYPHPGVTRYYAVTAYNAGGESEPSNELVK